MNFAMQVWYRSIPTQIIPADFYVWTPLLWGGLFLLTALWRSIFAAWTQVAILLIVALLGASTSHPSDITSALYLLLGLALLVEYRFNRIATYVVGGLAVLLYPIGLAHGYASYANAGALRTIEAL
ncbi:hypothetical protein, partial [Salinispira pacifica]